MAAWRAPSIDTARREEDDELWGPPARCARNTYQPKRSRSLLCCSPWARPQLSFEVWLRRQPRSCPSAVCRCNLASTVGAALALAWPRGYVSDSGWDRAMLPETYGDGFAYWPAARLQTAHGVTRAAASARARRRRRRTGLALPQSRLKLSAVIRILGDHAHVSRDSWRCMETTLQVSSNPIAASEGQSPKVS